MPSPAAQLAPTGKLRVAIAIAPSPSAQFAIKDEAGNYHGVAIILGQALAKKLGVQVDLVAHNGSGEIQNSAAANKWDVAFLPVDEERKKFVDFGNAYHLLQSTYLVAPSAKLNAVADANAAGADFGPSERLGLGGIVEASSEPLGDQGVEGGGHCSIMRRRLRGADEQP